MIYDNEPIKLNSHDPDNLFLMIPIDFKIFLHSFSSIFYFIFQHFLLYFLTSFALCFPISFTFIFINIKMGKVKRKDLGNNSQNKKRKFLSFAQKKELCEKHQDQNLNGMQLAREYGISDSTVSDILKKSEHWLSIDTILLSASNFAKKLVIIHK